MTIPVRLLTTILIVFLAQAAAAQDKLQAAVSFLAANGYPTPPGYTVQWGPTGGAAGSTNPQNGEINVNADGILALSPSLEGDPSQFGGVLVVIMLHEYGHADGTYVKTSVAGRACDHVQQVHEVAARNCQLVWLICDAIPGANVKPLCTFYSDVQDRYNNGADGNGGASAAHEQYGCTEPYPGDIPDCPACGPGGGCAGD